MRANRTAVLSALGILLAAMSAGCVLGPKSLRHSRLNYNRAVQKTSREELLLNLVRMRYHESEEFLGVSSITGQYQYTADLTGNNIWPRGSDGDLKIGAQTKPTIVYAPEQGKDFNQRKLSPVSVETLDLMASKGWAVDRVLRLTIRNMNDVDNATSAGGPTPKLKPEFEEFLYLTQLFRQLQLNQHSFEMSLEDRVTTEASLVGQALPLDQLTLDGQDIVTAASQGYEFRTTGDGKSAELWKRPVSEKVPVLRFAPNVFESTELAEIRRILELDPTLSSYRVRFESDGQLQSPNSRRFNSSGMDAAILPELRSDITISTRSLKEMMFYLSHAVNVPEEHQLCGYVPSTTDAAGVPFNWNDMTRGLFQVHFCETKPEDAAVAVKYRGYWFYVSDCDLDSKSTFNLLLELINLEIRAGGGAQIPLLTI